MRNTRITFADLLDVAVQGKDSRYFCQVTTPVEVSMGNWAADVAFFRKPNQLVYYRAGCKAHFDTSDHLVTPQGNPRLYLLNWSEEGCHVKFFEYMRNEVYQYVLLDLEHERCYRANSGSEGYSFLEALKDSSYSGRLVIDDLKGIGLKGDEVVKDPLPARDLLDRIFGWRKWHPDAK